MTVASSCKIVKQNVIVPGAVAQSEAYQGCKDKSCGWIMTRV